MKDKGGAVIYVGKAKNLANRVRSYFAGGDGRYNIPYLVALVRSIETIVTESERHAIVLEADLIKKYKPRYNIRLKDDKAHIIVRVDLNHEWPRLEVVRVRRDDDAKYIGPFAYGYEARMLLDVVRRVVPLRTCSDKVIYNRVRPCLEYEIKRCAGPCCLPVDRVEYLGWIDTAVQILEGRNQEAIELLESEMARASEELRYEDAADIRDRLEILTRSRTEEPTAQYPEGSLDAVGIYRENDTTEVSVLVFRKGRLFDARSFGIPDNALPEDELISSFLSQYSLAQEEIPETVLLPFEVEQREACEELFSERRGSSVSIAVPQRGPKLRIVGLALANARENFISRYGVEDRSDSALRSLQVELRLEQMPRLIECIDVSHFQGESTVASVVCFKDGHPDKSRYRHFILGQEGKPDDFASMREVVKRHLSRCNEENSLPDLIVIDGGPAQLSQALRMRAELGLEMPVMIGLAKKRGGARRVREGTTVLPKPERVYCQGESLPVILKPTSEGLRLLERVRDEAHRFAITFHRSRRTKKLFASKLDSIPGVGPERRKALLRAFGSVNRLKQADATEVVEKAGLPLSLAQRVLNTLQR